MARFTNRDDQQALFQHHLFSPQEPPVLMFYGVGGAGKTWLLKRLRNQVPADIPSAYLDFDVAAKGGRFVSDPATALQSIQHQLAAPAPRFDLALATMRHKQGSAEEPGLWIDVAAELLGSFVPGGGPLLKRLSSHVLSRLKGTPLEKLLASSDGSKLAIELRSKTEQEIGNELLYYLAADLRESLPVHLHRAVTCVMFFDTFEAVGAGFQNEEHKRLQGKWIQELAAEFDFALTVIAGQNRLSWDEADPDWANHLEQHLVGGLSEDDARSFLAKCDINAMDLQKSILATSKESTSGYHCFSLGLCADIVANERKTGEEPAAETLHFNPQEWEKLARRFLKSLASDAERRWIERLALTPRFDETAARWAFSSEHSAAQDAAWEGLHDYSFVERISGSQWSSIRAEMRSALKNQPSAQERVMQDHQLWKDYWSGRSKVVADDFTGLSWYHSYSLDPSAAMDLWNDLTEKAREAIPARMREHFSLLQWIEPVGLWEAPPITWAEARALYCVGIELSCANWNVSSSVQKAIACYEAALRVRTEQKYPENWANTQSALGDAWSKLPTGDRTANLENAIACYEAALHFRTEQKYPERWAYTQDALGNAWSNLPTGDRAANLEKALAYYEAALRVRTEQEHPEDWASTQISLGGLWLMKPMGDRTANLEKAISYFEAALHVYTEQRYPTGWASTQGYLGLAWRNLPAGDRAENHRKAIACYEAALRVYTEREFPDDWATAQNNLYVAWRELPAGDHAANLEKAVSYLDAALRVRTEQEFPESWAMIQGNLGEAWSEMPMGDRESNFAKALAFFDAALRVCTKEAFPEWWAEMQQMRGDAWRNLLIGDRDANLEKAISFYEAALGVYTEQGYPRDHKEVAEKLSSTRAALVDLQARDNSNPAPVPPPQPHPLQ
jgi:tetratricopeptide (TPR) repeat protein